MRVSGDPLRVLQRDRGSVPASAIHERRVRWRAVGASVERAAGRANARRRATAPARGAVSPSKSSRAPGTTCPAWGRGPSRAAMSNPTSRRRRGWRSLRRTLQHAGRPLTAAKRPLVRIAIPVARRRRRHSSVSGPVSPDRAEGRTSLPPLGCRTLHERAAASRNPCAHSASSAHTTCPRDGQRRTRSPTGGCPPSDLGRGVRALRGAL